MDTNLIKKSMPQPMFGYPHETGRTAMDLIVNNTLRTYPGCKIILSHAGGTLPYLIHRPAALLLLPPFNIGKSTEEIIEKARLFYFDTALSANPITLKALFELANSGHVMFGSDFLNVPTPSIEYFTNLGEFGMDEKPRREVYYEGALELFPCLKANYK